MIPTTLFIPLCSASSWQHNELRIALRSWQKFGNIETVLIIGHKPDWLINVHHVPFEERYGKVENIFRKVKLAATLYAEFIFANDDHILLKPLTELPYYYQGNLREFKGHAGDTFYRYVDTTYRLFPNGKYFDVHTPMVCRREIIDKLEWKRDVLFKSYYCNTAEVEGIEFKDCKIKGHIRRPEIESYVNGKPFISTDDSISVDMKKWLFEFLPNKSSFEM